MQTSCQMYSQRFEQMAGCLHALSRITFPVMRKSCAIDLARFLH
ncbi:hypothetical protein QUA81_30080 [Microcoleus sp. F6_B4]